MGLAPSAPEIYQRKMEEVFEKIENPANIYDDVLLNTTNIEQHCDVLRKTLERARLNNLTFRLSKLNVFLLSQRYPTLGLFCQRKVSKSNLKRLEQLSICLNQKMLRKLEHS